ncbi:MAG: transporter permease [Novosphingobium sp.]|nr:transporter permease [Novosphingobium sp.]
MKISVLATAFALTATLGAAQAHNAWLLPSTTVFSKADVVSIDAAVSNDLFVANHNPLRIDGLQVTAPDGSLVKPENEAKLKFRTVFDVAVAQPGTYRIAVINAGAFASWKDKAGQQKRARGTAETIAKEVPGDATDVVISQSSGRIETFVTVGKPSALKPIGQGLELISTGSPTDLVKGEKTTFTLNLDGQPAKDLEVTVTAGNTQYRDKLEETKVKTDAKGQFTVTWPAAGMYWLDASTKDNKTTVPQAKERRLSYAATLEVMP